MPLVQVEPSGVVAINPSINHVVEIREWGFSSFYFQIGFQTFSHWVHMITSEPVVSNPSPDCVHTTAWTLEVCDSAITSLQSNEIYVMEKWNGIKTQPHFENPIIKLSMVSFFINLVSQAWKSVKQY